MWETTQFIRTLEVGKHEELLKVIFGHLHIVKMPYN